MEVDSIEQYTAKLQSTNETNKLQIASYKWATAEWAYEYWHAEFFTEIYRDLENYRKTLLNSEADLASYKNSVHECMIAALKQLDENGFFAKEREEITLFISSSDDNEAFDMENRSAKLLNPRQIYLPFLKRYEDAVCGGVQKA